MTRTLNGCLIKHFINRLITADDRREYRTAVKILYSLLFADGGFFVKKDLPFAVCVATSSTHFGGSRTSPLQERKQS